MIIIKIITDKAFEYEVIGSELPVLVNFCASWCSPCKMVTPIIEELEEKYKEKIKFVKMDIDQNPLISTELQITDLPTLILFNTGKILNKTIGYKSKEQFEKIFKLL